MPHSSSRAQHASEPSLFITSSTTGKPDAQTRRLIRRHVMRGKNKWKQGEEKCVGQLGSTSDHWILTSPRKITSELSLLTGVPYMQHLIYRGIHCRAIFTLFTGLTDFHPKHSQSSSRRHTELRSLSLTTQETTCSASRPWLRTLLSCIPSASSLRPFTTRHKSPH